MRLKSLLKRHNSDAVVVPEELQQLRQYLMDFYRFPAEPVRARDIRTVVSGLEPFQDMDFRVWQLFLSEYDHSVLVAMYSMLLNIAVPLDDVESEELMHTFLEWVVTMTKLTRSENYKRIPVSMRLLSAISIILKAYPNERIALSLSNILELIARNFIGERIDASMNKTALESCLQRILDCLDSIYLCDSHALVKLTVLINDIIANRGILEIMASCPNLDRYRDLFCRYWNLGNSVQFYIPVIVAIFASSDTFFTNDDARIVVNTLLNTLSSSQDPHLNNLLINCLKAVTSSAKFRKLGERTAKRALFIVNNLVEWTDSDPATTDNTTTIRSQRRASLPSAFSPTPVENATPGPPSQRRASLQEIQYQLACIADS